MTHSEKEYSCKRIDTDADAPHPTKLKRFTVLAEIY